MSSSSAVLLRRPLDIITDGVGPLLDFLWHYDCIVSPKSSLNHVLSRVNESCSRRQSLQTISNEITRPNPVIDVAERRLLQRVFSKFDENGDGLISKDELRRFQEKLGILMSDENLSSLLGSVCLKVDGYVDIDEFFVLFESSCDLINEFCESASTAIDDEVLLLEAFNIFDKDRNGLISPAELQHVLCCLGFMQARELAACEEMIKQVDEDGNGQVDFSEFRKMMSSPGFHAKYPL